MSCRKHERKDGYPFTDKRGYARWTCRICRRAAGRRRFRERQMAKAAVTLARR